MAFLIVAFKIGEIEDFKNFPYISNLRHQAGCKIRDKVKSVSDWPSGSYTIGRAYLSFRSMYFYSPERNASQLHGLLPNI